ncbi:MAG: hypothetical protein ABW275_10815 [Hansschlegelia sp.]
MKMLLAAAGALALVSTAASADPVTRRTVTGYSASAAVQDGVPVERPDPAAAPSDQATATAVAGPVAQGPDGTLYAVPDRQADPHRRSMGLFGLSWTSQ